MLFIGGYTHAAERVAAHTVRRDKGRVGITVAEHKLMRSLRDSLYGRSEAALACLHHLLVEKHSQQAFKHAVMLALYYVYLQRRELDHARAIANAIWAEAESVRQHLQSTGERALPGDATLPAPPTVVSSTLRAYVEKIER